MRRLLSRPSQLGNQGSSFVVAVFVLLTSSTSPLFVLSVVDAARVLSQPERVYLTRAVPGRLDCPADANPPITHVAWTKDGRPVQVVSTRSDSLTRPFSDEVGLASGSGRLSMASDGALVFSTVTSDDAGRYACTPHSALGTGQTSVPVQVLVKGT